ncbi:MAG: hypothetical protein ACRDZ5_11080, partial [Acidimicrobiales bacterium]
STAVPSALGVGEPVDPYDAAAIAGAIVSLSEPGEAREAAISAGAERAASLTWESAAASHLELWEKLAGG